MFTVLVLMMLAAIALSLFGREGEEVRTRPVLRRAAVRAPRPKKARQGSGAVIGLALGGGVLLILALLMDYHILFQPAARTATSAAPVPAAVPAPVPGPGPGWKTDQGVALPPSGFSGRAIVRFEQGVTARGVAVIAHGQFKRVGWRITGQDAAYCFLDVEIDARPNHRNLDPEGYSYADPVLDEGWHEAKIKAWCPPDHPSARFDISARNVAPGGLAGDTAAWTEAGDDDIRHR